MTTTVALVRRGTTNRNDRGSSYARRARREYLVETYRADEDALLVTTAAGEQFTATNCEGNRVSAVVNGASVKVAPACRCYRCGALLTVETVTVDRIVPGCKGGTYRRTNIRPACGPCNFSTGGVLGNERKRS